MKILKFFIFFSNFLIFSCVNDAHISEFEKYFESTQPLFSKIDPTLGYSHNYNRNIKEQTKSPFLGFSNSELNDLGNGFALLEYRNLNEQNKDSKNIVILGSSNSDPYLFHGNWPFQLHLWLKERGVSHKIYNGAVSGYNSSQCLLKLLRDAFNLGKIDYVVYMGPTADFSPSFGDITAEHPFVHPITKTLFKFVSDIGPISDTSSETVFGNFFNQILQFKKKSNLQLGTTNTHYFENAKKNILYMNAITEINSAKFIYIVDILNENTEQIVEENRISQIPKELEKEGRIFNFRMKEEMKKFPFTHIIDDLPKKEKIFYDYGHLTIEGSKLVSEKIGILIK